MSNVPAFPRNPALHSDSSHDPLHEERREDSVAFDNAVDVRDLDLSEPEVSFRSLVISHPIPAVLIAAGIGLLIGNAARR